MLMSGIIHCFSSEFTEADILNQTQSTPVLLISLASLFWGPLDLLAEAGIGRRDAKPCGLALHVGCRDPTQVLSHTCQISRDLYHDQESW